MVKPAGKSQTRGKSNKTMARASHGPNKHQLPARCGGTPAGPAAFDGLTCGRLLAFVEGPPELYRLASLLDLLLDFSYLCTDLRRRRFGLSPSYGNSTTVIHKPQCGWDYWENTQLVRLGNYSCHDDTMPFKRDNIEDTTYGDEVS